MGKPTLVVLDDNPDWGSFVAEVAEKVGFIASKATNHGDFSEIAKTKTPDVLVLDLLMPEKDGIETIMGMQGGLDEMPFVIFISGQSKPFLESAVKLGWTKGLEVVGALGKPFRLIELQALLEKSKRLFEQKRKLADNLGAGTIPRRIPAAARNVDVDSGPIASPNIRMSNGGIGQEMLQIQAFPQLHNGTSLSLLRDHVRGTETNENLKHCITEINAEFCFMLWDTQLATLNALNVVPSRMAEAAAAMIASENGTKDAKSWREAANIHLRTLIDGKAVVGTIANSLQLHDLGQSTIELIDQISATVAEILDSKQKSSAHDVTMPNLFRQLCRENDCLKENLATLFAALRRVMAKVHKKSGLAGTANRRSLSQETDRAVVVELGKVRRK